MSSTTSPLSIFFVAAEVAPFATVGGLSQVLYFLPRELKTMGHRVSVFMPKYGTINETKYGIKPFLANLKVPTGEKTGYTHLVCNVKVRKGSKYEPTVYFLENMEYYEKRANVYRYNDDHARFGLLSRGALEFLRHIEESPDIIHLNDWHSAYVANYLKTIYKDDPILKDCATVLTIHNLAHQGVFDFRFASPLDFDDGQGPLAPFFSDRFKKQNTLKRGIIHSDLVNTVSERHSREIMTKEYGEGLDELLKQVRTKVFGVLNGIDTDDFNPKTDKLIRKNFSVKTISDRLENKIDLQKEFNLPVDPQIPIIAMTSRLSVQKGFDLVMEILPYLLKEYQIQFIVLGEGTQKYKEFFLSLEKEFPKQVGTHLMANWQLPRKIFAGTDMYLLPSKFEPGGIVVVEAMRYGAVPVVRSTGGLADSVINFDIETSSGNGFVFQDYSKLALFGALVRALEIYKHKTVWNGIIKRAMQADFSWEAAARKYLDLYERAAEFHKETRGEKVPRVEGY